MASVHAVKAKMEKKKAAKAEMIAYVAKWENGANPVVLGCALRLVLDTMLERSAERKPNNLYLSGGKAAGDDVLALVAVRDDLDALGAKILSHLKTESGKLFIGELIGSIARLQTPAHYERSIQFNIDMKRFSRPDTHAEIDTDIQVIITLADFARILNKEVA